MLIRCLFIINFINCEREKFGSIDIKLHWLHRIFTNLGYELHEISDISGLSAIVRQQHAIAIKIHKTF